MIKIFLKKLILAFIKTLNKTSIGYFINKVLLTEAMNQKKNIDHNGIQLSFSTPNSLNDYRASSFSLKEPETLEWIDGFDDNSVFWDVGANVGLYSCYAASKKGCQIVAFEPSVFNLELLARNISNNNLIDKISIMPLAISYKQDLNKLNLSTTEWGGALSTFGESYGQDGKDLNIQFSFNTFGISLDMAHEIFKLPKPKYLKIDVDGIEHLILQGGLSILHYASEVLVEINEGFIEQSDNSFRILTEAGFKIDRTGEYVHPDNDSGMICNQIWIK